MRCVNLQGTNKKFSAKDTLRRKYKRMVHFYKKRFPPKENNNGHSKNITTVATGYKKGS